MCCGLVRDKTFNFCLVPYPSICPIPKTNFQLITTQLNLSCSVTYFLADQTNPKNFIIMEWKEAKVNIKKKSLCDTQKRYNSRKYLGVVCLKVKNYIHGNTWRENE